MARYWVAERRREGGSLNLSKDGAVVELGKFVMPWLIFGKMSGYLNTSDLLNDFCLRDK